MQIFLGILLCFVIGLLVSFVYVKGLKKRVFGRWPGALFIAFLGASFGYIFHFVLIYIYKFFVWLLDGMWFLMGMKGEIPPIDIPASVIASIIFVVILHKMTPGN